MFVFRLQAIYLTHGQGEKNILQTFLRTGSNSCVWGGQSLAKIGKKESFSTGHPNNSGGRSAASICNKALAVSCKSFCMERLRSFLAWGWSWLDMKETSPWDGTYFRWFVRSDLYFWCQQMVKRKEMSNQMMFPKQIVCPRYILSCLVSTHALLSKGMCFRAQFVAKTVGGTTSRFRLPPWLIPSRSYCNNLRKVLHPGGSEGLDMKKKKGWIFFVRKINNLFGWYMWLCGFPKKETHLPHTDSSMCTNTYSIGNHKKQLLVYPPFKCLIFNVFQLWPPIKLPTFKKRLVTQSNLRGPQKHSTAPHVGAMKHWAVQQYCERPWAS